MQTATATPATKPKKARGRPRGSKDAAPRKRRRKGELVAVAKTARKVRESDIQAQFIKWLATVAAPGFPGLKLGDFTHAIPNGIWIPAPLQQRIMIIMSQRRQGLRKGYPDVCIDVPLHGRPGARIELKRDERAEISDEQVEWCTRLRLAGFFVEVTMGLSGACEAVGRYLRGETPRAFPWEEQVDNTGASASGAWNSSCELQDERGPIVDDGKGCG